MADAAAMIEYSWRGPFTNDEVNHLHAEAFGTKVYDESEWNWVTLTDRHSMGWVTARTGGQLVGFINVVWDGLVHAWIQDVMVASTSRHRRVATTMVERVCSEAANAGCEWVHVDFDEDLADFYLAACGFEPTGGGIRRLG